MRLPTDGMKRQNGRKLLCILLLGISYTMQSHAGWQSQWIDPFNGSGIDWTKWTAQTQANYNAEVQCYTDDDSTANKNYDVSGGTLKIIARRQNINCPGLGNAPKEWTSGRINSKDKREFLYGRIESRIRFLDLKAGTWPAFWMLENRIAEQPIAGDNDFIGWPAQGAGEIDVWEWVSKEPTTYITNFFNADNANCGGLQLYNYPGGASDVQQWHDYAIEWDANAVSFYVDDTLVVTQDISTCAQYKEPMFVLLNVAMGGNLGGPIDGTLNTATMEVDYIAHCVPTNTNTATRCNESTPTVSGSGQIAPVIISGPDTKAFSNNLYSYTLIAFDGNGDPLTMSALTLPDWLSFNSTSGLLSGTPADANEGAHSVTLKVSDGIEEVTQTFTISVTAVRAPGDLTGSSGSIDLLLLFILSGFYTSGVLLRRQRSELPE